MLHPPDCPSWFPLHSADYVYSSPRCFARFISSCMIRGAPIYPRFPCVTRSPCDGVGRATGRLLLSGIAKSVENVLHVTWLPDRCMTASQLTRFQPNLLPRCCFALFGFQFNHQRATALEWVHHEQIRESCIALHVCHPASSTVLCRQIVMHKPSVTLSDADHHVLKVGFADLGINFHQRAQFFCFLLTIPML